MNKPTKRSQRHHTCERIASWTVTGYQPALGLTDFPMSVVFGLDIGFPTGTDWNYMSGSRHVDSILFLSEFLTDFFRVPARLSVRLHTCLWYSNAVLLIIKLVSSMAGEEKQCLSQRLKNTVVLAWLLTAKDPKTTITDHNGVWFNYNGPVVDVLRHFQVRI